MKLRTILLFGSPGAGKGTQGKILGKIPNYLHVSSGDLFRNLRVQNPIGQTFLNYASKGQLVPDEPTIKLWHDDIENRIHNGTFNPETDTLLLDGIPRNAAQAELLDDTLDLAGGPGLGLAIVRDVAEIYGGSVDLAESEDLGGLLVRLSLPRS